MDIQLNIVTEHVRSWRENHFYRYLSFSSGEGLKAYPDRAKEINIHPIQPISLN